MGHALIDAAADAGIRLTLLDTCYLTSGGRRRAAGRRTRNSGSATATAHAWAQRVESLQATPDDRRTRRRRNTFRARGARRRDGRRRRLGGAPRRPAAHPLLRADRRGRPVPGRARAARPTALMRDHGVLGTATTAVHATHLTERDIADLRRHRHRRLLLPHHRTRSRRRRRTRTRADRRAGPVQPGLRQPRRHRPVRRGPRRRTRRAAVPSRARSAGRAALLEAATFDGHRALGWSDAGALRVGARADLVAVDLESVRTAGGGATVENAVFAAAAADVTDVVVDGRHRGGGPHPHARSRTRAQCWQRRSPR